MSDPPRVFVLSPASLSGARGRRVVDGTSSADFMDVLRGGGDVPLGEVFASISSLYYRGKRSYARRFGRRPGEGPSRWVVTPDRGLLPDDHPVGLEDLRAFARGGIDPDDPAYLEPLLDTAGALDRELEGRGEVVLLGSIASGRYLDPLARVFRRRLLVPRAFVGRGDMSRGGLLLRAVDAGVELDYVVALETERRGSRPPKLKPRRAGPGSRGGRKG